MPNSSIKLDIKQNQPPENSVLYRYITIDKFIDFLINNRIPLVRLSEFEDKLEGVSLFHHLINYTSHKIAENANDWSAALAKAFAFNFHLPKGRSIKNQSEIIQNTNYASCWYINNYESVAMWQLYSKPDSIAIRIPYKILSNELLSHNFELTSDNIVKIKLGSIDYFRFNDIDELMNIAYKIDSIGFIKDLSFKHENEFRIIIET